MDMIWGNTGAEPLVNYSFMLRVELLWDLPCKRIVNIRRENEFDYIQEGGLNDYVHARRKPVSKPNTFQVERYVGIDAGLGISVDPLSLGTELIFPLLLFVNKYPLWKGGETVPVRTYVFIGCTVIGKDYGELNAEQSGLLVEATTISFNQMICLDLFSEMVKLDHWKFDGTKDGKGTRNAKKHPQGSEKTKAQMEQKSHLWPNKKSAQTITQYLSDYYNKK